MKVSRKVIKLAVCAILGVVGIFVISSAFAAPYALTTIYGFYQLVIGAVMIWGALTMAIGKKQHSSDTAVLMDDHPPTQEETARREAINMTYAVGSDAHPHGDNTPLGYSYHDPVSRGSAKDDERRR